MEKLIYLSPSDQTDNRYAYGNTTEAAQCRKIADACEAALKRNGFSVINNQKSNMYGRVNESNEKKADLHVCIHTNAFNGTVSGTRMFAWDLKGAGYKAANAVFYYLAPLTPGQSENIKAADYYEIKYTDAPCVYCECEFHDVASVAKWIIEHTTDIGEAIAKGICKYYGVTFNEGKTESQNSLVKTYKVVAGDTLWEIARNHGTTVDTLARLNNIKDPNKISVGQIIKLPTAPTTQTKALKVGSTVKIKAGAKDLNNGKQFADFVYKKNYTVIEISGSRVVFGIGKTVTGAVDKSQVIIQ